jgi:hypothetical protein
MKRINIVLVSVFLVLFLFLPFTLATQKEVGRDGVYVAYANGVVMDKTTGFEWLVGPDKDTNWNQAKSWVQGLGDGWRMPTLDELAGLYKKGAGPRNMTPLLKTTGWWVWSGETILTSSTTLSPERSLKEGRLMFLLGNRRWADRDYSFNGRAFAVRDRNDG